MADVSVPENRIAKSGLITLDLETLIPQRDIVAFDLKSFLVQETVLMEKKFRGELKEHDWQAYQGKTIALHCSADALIPHWAWMLVTTYLFPVADDIVMASPQHVEHALLMKAIDALDATEYTNARVIVKGCSDKTIQPEAYMAISAKLLPEVKTLMYGEPCSTVPVYKKPKK